MKERTVSENVNSNIVHLYNRQQAADYLGVSATTLAIWASTKRYDLKMIKIGRLAKYRKSDLDDFINSRVV